MSTRRAFMGLLASGVLAAARPARAQQTPSTARIGWLAGGGSKRNAPLLAAFRQGLQELGYVEGRDFSIEARFAEGHLERAPALTAELIRLEPRVLVVESTRAAQAAKAATNTIPIVMALVPDPVGDGLVASLARPGGNVTGLSDLQTGILTKRFELLKAAVPSASRIATLANPANKVHATALRALRTAAPSLGVTLLTYAAGWAEDIEKTFVAMRRDRAEALHVLGDPLFGVHATTIITLAAKHRLPALYQDRRWAEAGGLMSYGTSYPELFRRAATYVDKILKGAKPADLPVEQPTTFELVINLKTAKALGLAIPPSLLLRADQVIE